MRKIVFSAFVFALMLPAILVAQPGIKENSYTYKGRTELLADGKVAMISSACSIGFDFEGDKCEIQLESKDSWEHQNYVSIELDGKYLQRIRIEKGPAKFYKINVPDQKAKHKLIIYKATEAANGTVIFSGTTVNPIKQSKEIKKRIEFIGNSITCGMGNDTAEIPCGTGEWFDQHNAYWAYGPILSRTLNADFLLSSVSGIGMYRNWNDEGKEAVIMPQVYENLYLNLDSSKPYSFDFQPDLVSICLGTNDLSDGDGKKARSPFDPEKYVTNYIAFIKTIYKRSPNTRIVLLNSPMISGEKNVTLVNCLKRVIAAFDNDQNHKKIALFEYQPMKPSGCTYHPNIDDHKVMAAQLEPFFKKLLNEK